MKPPIMSDADALKARRQTGTWKPGWYFGRIDACLEKVSGAGNECFEWSVIVRNAAGDERTIRDFGVSTPFGMLKLKHCIEAVGAGDKYEAGEEITQDDFPGHDVEVKLAIEKKRGFRDRNIIEDYRPASSSSVVQLRSAS
jgi:hypothetical protein